MKVTKSMIAKDLRIWGKLYKLLLSKPIRKSNRPIKEPKIRNTNSSKNTYNVYLKREDGTKLRVMIRKPKEKYNIGVLWIHGGGYITGLPEMTYLSMANKIAKKALLISPDYRLANKAPYPAALEDCYLTLEWMKENAESLGINKNQLFVGGESAGGGLTVALCLLARDRKKINIACQMPLYPMINNEKTSSKKDNNAPVWNEKQDRDAWNLYLDGLKEIPKYATPSKETNYKDLPPAITFVGTIDPFYDETKDYVKKLQENNIEVSFKTFKGCYHAFDMMVPLSKEAKDASKFFMEKFNYATKNYFKEQEEKTDQ